MQLNLFLILIFTVGINIPSFSQNALAPFNLNQTTSKKVKKEKAKWERQRINSTIIDKSGQAFEGQLLYTTDSTIYQLLSFEKYSADVSMGSILKFNVDDIDQINLQRKGQTLRAMKNALFWGAAGTLALTFITEESAWGRLWNLLGATIWVMPTSILTGVITGSGRKIDLQYKINDNHDSYSGFLIGINKYALFEENPPNELHLVRKTDHSVLPPSTYNVETHSTMDDYDEFKNPNYISRFHFGMGTGLSSNYLKAIFINSMNQQAYYATEIKDRFLNDIKLEMGFSYRLNEHIRIALTFHPKSYWTEGGYEQSLFDNYYASSSTYSYGSSTIIGAEYVFNPVTRIQNSRFELTTGLGIAINPITVDHSLSITQKTIDTHYYHETYSSMLKMTKWGIKAQFGVDYYLTRNFSLYMKTAAFYFTNTSLPQMNVKSEYLGISGTLKPHQTNISTIDLFVGLHVHF